MRLRLISEIEEVLGVIVAFMISKHIDKYLIYKIHRLTINIVTSALNQGFSSDGIIF